MSRIKSLAALLAAGLVLLPGGSTPAAPIVWDDATMSVSASSQLRVEYDPANTVNLSGLAPGGTHSADGNDMWMGDNGDVADAWIEFDLGQVFTLSKAHIWAYNRAGYTNRSMQQADVLTSIDGATWTPVAEDAIFPQSPGNSSYPGFEFEFAPGGSDARYVRIEADTNYGTDAYGNYTGLSEIRLYDTTPSGPQALLLDFGESGTGYSGTESPAHAAGAVTDPFWSNVSDDTAAGGLQLADGTLAPDVAVQLGAETGPDSNVIDWNGAIKRFSSANSGIFGTDLMQDIVARDGSGARAIGAMVTGLEPGDYELFVMARNPSTSAGDNGTDDQQVYVGVVDDPAAGTTDFSGFLSELITDNTQTTWIDGANYAQMPFSLGEGQALVVVADRINGSQVGVLNGLAIVGPAAAVVVPEPGTLALLALGGLTLAGCGLRRRRRLVHRNN